MTYLRARYLNTDSGAFNRTDPFFGYLEDPQSLHKYASSMEIRSITCVATKSV